MSVYKIAITPMQNAAINWLVVFTSVRRIVLSGAFVLLVLCISCSQADLQSGSDSGAVHSHTLEYDRDNDGQSDMRVDTVTRDRKILYVRVDRRLESGMWDSTRSYSVSGKMVAVEEDKDGDGFFETMVVFDSSRKEMEVFSRQRDGSTVVASTNVNTSYRKMFQAVGDFWDNTPSTTDYNTAEKLIRETKEKIDSASERIGREQSSEKVRSDN